MLQPKKPVKKKLSPAPKPKTGMDALKALAEYFTTFGFATEGYNPAKGRYAEPSKKAKTIPKQKKGGAVKAKKNKKK